MMWREWTPGRYRWRTCLRGLLPYRPPLYELVPNGRGDCGNHEWYRHDETTLHCYHCIAARPDDGRLDDYSGGGSAR
jgi:hypothetical protein